MKVRKLVADDIPGALELSTVVGWNQTAEDWRLTLELSDEGCFGIECEGLLAATASLICYGRRLAWVGMVLTRPEFRRRGFARRLLAEVLSLADNRGIQTVKLDATAQGQPLYESLGFIAEQAVERWSRDGAQAERAPVDRDRLREFLSRGNVTDEIALWRNGRVASYLGPCVSKSRESARQLIAETLGTSGERWFWDLLPENRNAAQLAAEFGFKVERPLVRMYRGEPLHVDQSRLYAIAGFEFG